MKRIEAIVRTARLDDIVERLRLIGVSGMTVSEVHGFSASTATTLFHGQRIQFATPRYQLMVVVQDDDVAHVVAAIQHSGHTDTPGDGIITVVDVLGVMRIRTGEIDEAAL